MQCENCKKESATIHTTEISHQKIKKEVHLCNECMGKSALGLFYLQCEKCKKKSVLFKNMLSKAISKMPSAAVIKVNVHCDKCSHISEVHLKNPYNLRNDLYESL